MALPRNAARQALKLWRETPTKGYPLSGRIHRERIAVWYRSSFVSVTTHEEHRIRGIRDRLYGRVGNRFSNPAS